MNIALVPLISFVVATTFSPGPNNIASASMGLTYGYRRTLGFLLGVTTGFFCIMMGCAFLSSTLLELLPAAEQYLRWAGALYIAWMGVGMLKTRDVFLEREVPPRAFVRGMVLQLVNPKALVYGMTLYSTFLSSISGQVGPLACFGLCFSGVTFIAASLWALCGAAIKNRLASAWFAKSVNAALFMLLMYTALDLSGLLP
ncbi:MAG: LysE family translocator [Desulfobacterales bacterium]|nr:LysE family translocator [Desulfobacterales bacterium]